MPWKKVNGSWILTDATGAPFPSHPPQGNPPGALGQYGLSPTAARSSSEFADFSFAPYAADPSATVFGGPQPDGGSGGGSSGGNNWVVNSVETLSVRHSFPPYLCESSPYYEYPVRNIHTHHKLNHISLVAIDHLHKILVLKPLCLMLKNDQVKEAVHKFEDKVNELAKPASSTPFATSPAPPFTKFFDQQDFIAPNCGQQPST